MPIRYLTTRAVLRIHFRMVKRFGGSQGVRDLGLVESALARPKAGFDDFEAYLDIFTKTAVLMHSLLKNHPFVDGNKRTATIAATIFLKRNGFKLQVTQKEFVRLALDIENNALPEDKIASWLKKHSRKIRS